MLKDREEKKKYCWHFWPLFKCDLKYIPAYLEEKERNGYRFCSLGWPLPFAKYQKVKPQEARYDIDVFRPKAYIEIQPYLDLCEDAGWEICWQWDEYKIFRGKEGEAPIALQSDPEMKEEQEKGIIKRDLKGSVFLCAWFALLSFWLRNSWNQSRFYLAPLSLQWLTVIVLAVFAGSFFVLLFQLFRAYQIYRGKKNQEELKPEETLKVRKLGMGWIKAGSAFFAANMFIFTTMLLVSDPYRWGSMIGALIGGSIGGLIRFSIVTSDWPSEKQMKGVRTKTQYILTGILALLLFVSLFFGIRGNKEIMSGIEKSNFYVKEMLKSEEYYSPKFGGSIRIEARTQAASGKIWNALHRELQQAEDDKSPKWNVGTRRQVLKGEQLKQYGEYSKGFLYPQNGRVLLRKEKVIYITDKIEKED